MLDRYDRTAPTFFESAFRSRASSSAMWFDSVMSRLSACWSLRRRVWAPRGPRPGLLGMPPANPWPRRLLVLGKPWSLASRTPAEAAPDYGLFLFIVNQVQIRGKELPCRPRAPTGHVPSTCSTTAGPNLKVIRRIILML